MRSLRLGVPSAGLRAEGSSSTSGSVLSRGLLERVSPSAPPQTSCMWQNPQNEECL